MDIQIHAARMQLAQQRIDAAAETLGSRFDVAEQSAAVLAAHHKDADLDKLFRLEALANLLDAIANSSSQEPTPAKARPASKKTP